MGTMRYKNVPNRWYPGYIEGVDAESGTCSIQYDDGDYEPFVPPSLIRRSSKPDRSLENIFEEIARSSEAAAVAMASETDSAISGSKQTGEVCAEKMDSDEHLAARDEDAMEVEKEADEADQDEEEDQADDEADDAWKAEDGGEADQNEDGDAELPDKVDGFTLTKADNASGYKGVICDQDCKLRFRAVVVDASRTKRTIGRFATAVEAAVAYARFVESEKGTPQADAARAMPTSQNDDSNTVQANQAPERPLAKRQRNGSSSKHSSCRVLSQAAYDRQRATARCNGDEWRRGLFVFI